LPSTPPDALQLNPAWSVPTHIAIIMDGNGRWARSRNLPRLAGHRAGTENLRRVIRACVEFGVRYLTIYAFSTENWARPEEEVEGLMEIMEEFIDKELDELDAEGVQIRHVGKLEGVRPSLQRKIQESIERTRDNQRLVLNVAFNYGGRDDRAGRAAHRARGHSRGRHHRRNHCRTPLHRGHSRPRPGDSHVRRNSHQ